MGPLRPTSNKCSPQRRNKLRRLLLLLLLCASNPRPLKPLTWCKAAAGFLNTTTKKTRSEPGVVVSAGSCGQGVKALLLLDVGTAAAVGVHLCVCAVLRCRFAGSRV